MSEWKTLPFEQVIEKGSLSYGVVQPGPHKEIGGIPIIRVTNIKNGKINPEDIKKIDAKIAEKYERTRLQGGELLITVVGSVGEVVIVPEIYKGWNVARAVSISRISDDFDKRFIRYCFYSEDVRFQMYGRTNDTVQPTLNLSSLKQIELSIPPLPEQNAIAAVLSSLDDKIDLLQRQNATLEAMAQTLFRQWFVEEADDVWEEIELGDYVDCTTGYSYRSKYLNPSNNALVTLKNFARDGSFRMDGFKEYTGDDHKNEQVVVRGDLVVAHTDITQNADIVGNPALVVDTGKYEKLIMTMDLMKVESTVDWLSKEFLYSLFKSREFKHYCLGRANGTTVLHLNRKAIPEFEFQVSSKKRIQDFTDIASPMIRKQHENIYQIRTLEKLRDTLLPKLMSGEVRVAHTE